MSLQKNNGSILKHMFYCIFSILPFFAISCAKPINITSYPVVGSELPEEPQETNTDDYLDEESRYLSAYAAIETQDIKRLWGTKIIDNILISAKVVLPNYEKEKVLEFPLYSISEGQVSSYQGVDLLRKYPLISNMRDQVNITITARYIKGAEAMKKAKAILRHVESIAKPLIENYPLASTIVSGAMKMIDDSELVKQKDNVAPNSYSTALNTDSLDYRKTFIQAYMFQVENSSENETTKKSAKPNTDSDANEMPKSIESYIFPCDDKKAYLCTNGIQVEDGPSNPKRKYYYQRHRVKDVVYMTITYQPFSGVYDPRALIKSNEDCLSITAENLKNARNYLIANEGLFHPRDVQALYEMYRIGEYLIKAREYRSGSQYGPMLDLLNTSQSLNGHSQTSNESRQGSLERNLEATRKCWNFFWKKESPGKELLKIWQSITDLNDNTIIAAKDKRTEDSKTKTEATDKNQPQQDLYNGSVTALKLDFIGRAISDLALLYGYQYRADLKDENLIWINNAGQMVKLLHNQAKALSSLLLSELESLNKADDDACDEAVNKSSMFCTKCITKAKEICSKDKGQKTKSQNETEGDVGTRLERRATDTVTTIQKVIKDDTAPPDTSSSAGVPAGANNNGVAPTTPPSIGAPSL